MTSAAPLRMSWVESSRSSAVSTSVTSTSASCVPHGVCWPKLVLSHDFRSVSPLLAIRAPASS